jgi:hypothetical protein
MQTSSQDKLLSRERIINKYTETVSSLLPAKYTTMEERENKSYMMERQDEHSPVEPRFGPRRPGFLNLAEGKMD